MGLTLVIMAAGMGSRFGGVKQIEPVGPNGELIIDYSVYDAVRCGFDKIVFVIKRDIEEAFRERIFNRISLCTGAVCVFQEMNDLPPGYAPPTDRIKPWGTAHAVLAARHEINGPFTVINADDYYGRDTYRITADFLNGLKKGDKYKYCIPGFLLKNTLPDMGYVSRGVCQRDENGMLTVIDERTHIRKLGDEISYKTEADDFVPLDPGSVVSMNFFGFTPEIIGEFEKMFKVFLKEQIHNNKSEFLLPACVDELLRYGRISVSVLPCNEKWYGFTYKEDMETVINAVNRMIEKGVYPKKLWD